MLYVRFVIAIFAFALTMPIPRNTRPPIERSINPNTCSTRQRIFDLERLFCFCSSFNGCPLKPFSQIMGVTDLLTKPLPLCLHNQHQARKFRLRHHCHQPILHLVLSREQMPMLYHSPLFCTNIQNNPLSNKNLIYRTSQYLFHEDKMHFLKTQ